MNADTLWRRGIREVHIQAAGLLELHIITHKRRFEIAISALYGDPGALRLLATMDNAVRQIEETPASSSKLCACCPDPLRRGKFIVGVTLPARPDATHCAAFGICQACAADEATLHDKALAVLRELWPEGRPVTIQAGGRA